MADDAGGFRHLAGYYDRAGQERLLAAVRGVIAEAPFYTPTMPRWGTPLSVAMTNCGALGWLTDKSKGYRYEARHPATDNPWPPIPDLLLDLWHDLAPAAAAPEACLVNWYCPKARMGMHRDADEKDFAAPVISVSLGDDAWFRIGGADRRDASERILLRSGDVAVLGGAARLAYHGIDRILPGTSDLLGEPGRINLTLRRVSASST